MRKRELMQAEILVFLEKLSYTDIEEVLAIVRQKISCSQVNMTCETCDLAAAAETCRLLLTMDKWERKGYLRWMKAKHPEATLS